MPTETFLEQVPCRNLSCIERDIYIKTQAIGEKLKTGSKMQYFWKHKGEILATFGKQAKGREV